jgi:hypothetical protein
MAAKKKTKKNARVKKNVHKKAAVMTAKRPKKLIKTKAAAKKLKKKASSKKRTRTKREYLSTQAFSPEVGARSVGQSGDLQGVSRLADADSESVEELLEEGNTFEAGAVLGVEEADSHDEKEVRTREVPEDDVPSEYLDKE